MANHLKTNQDQNQQARKTVVLNTFHNMLSFSILPKEPQIAAKKYT